MPTQCPTCGADGVDYEYPGYPLRCWRCHWEIAERQAQR